MRTPLHGVSSVRLLAMITPTAPAACAAPILLENVQAPRRITAILPAGSLRCGSTMPGVSEPGTPKLSVSQPRPTHTASAVIGPVSAILGWLPAPSSAGYTFPARGPLSTVTLEAVTVTMFPVWLASKSSPAVVLTPTPGTVFQDSSPKVKLPSGCTVTQALKSSSPSTTIVPSSLGHIEWLVTSPSSEPFSTSSACETTSGLAGSLMSSRISPESQAAAYIRLPSSVTVMSCTERMSDPPNPGVRPARAPPIHSLIMAFSVGISVSLYGSSLHHSSSQRNSGPHALTNCGF